MHEKMEFLTKPLSLHQTTATMRATSKHLPTQSAHWKSHKKAQKILFSYHGLPEQILPMETPTRAIATKQLDWLLKN